MSRFYAAVLSLLLLPIFVAQPIHAAPVSSSQVLANPIRGETDKRDYRNIILSNGMKVLLVSDPSADKAAAAVDVATGSGNDPVSRPGLSHFLEHMLFLGTKKYPKPGEYQAFISAHGGSHNAFTSLEHTNYFFDIDASSLKPALDRFSQFFIAPLFNEAYVEREKNAVNSEYQARIRDDERRAADVYRELYSEKNPAEKFSVGSLDTLADKPNDKVRDDLLAYYQQHYSSNIMTLTVLGREPLPELQAMVEQFFSAVPNHNLTIDNSAKPVFREHLLPARVAMQSVRDERHLMLTFPLPSMQPYWRMKPSAYISYLLGHEGEGSLFADLKQRGWAESLAAGNGLSNRFASTMDIDIKLTAEGYKHINDIVGLFFYTVDMLKKQGVEAWQYDEQKALADLAFRFHEKDDAMMYVSMMANNLQYFPAVDVLRGSYLMEGMDASVINDILSRLQPSNMLVAVSAPNIQGNKKSRYYNTVYQESSIDDATLAAWQHPAKDIAITMPKPNVFIPSQLALKVAHPVTANKTQSTPRLITNTSNQKLWFLQDTQFNVPKGSVMVYAHSPYAATSAVDAVKTEMFVRLLMDKLNTTLYEAKLAGLALDVSRRTRGIALELSGYSDKQGLLLKTVMDVFRQPAFDETRFSLLKLQWQDALRNAKKKSPYMPLMQDVATVMVGGYWPLEEYAKALDSIRLSDVQSYMLNFSKTMQLDVLVHGNFYKADAEKLGQLLQGASNTRAASAKSVPSRVVALPAMPQPALYVDALEHNDAALVKYFQASSDDVAQQVQFMMLDQVLASPFFDALRTEQQLGYIVVERYLPLVRAPGIAFLVQSPTHNIEDINARADTFIKNYYDVLSKHDDAWFAQQKQALLLQLSERPKSLGEQTARFWDDLLLGYTAFDLREQQINALQKMTKQDVLAAYKNVLLTPETRELLVVSPGKQGIDHWRATAAKSYFPVTDVDAFKRGHSAFVLQ
jgi:secreted Zn-dependent insulinase-like peptidase